MWQFNRGAKAFLERNVMINRSLLTQEAVQDVYDKRARISDLTVWFYCLADTHIGGALSCTG